jgi:hypothetical protein
MDIGKNQIFEEFDIRKMIKKMRKYAFDIEFLK